MVVQIVRVRKGVVDRKCKRKREKEERRETEDYHVILNWRTTECTALSFDHGLLSNIGLVRDRETLHEMQARRRGVKADKCTLFPLLPYSVMHLPTSSHL